MLLSRQTAMVDFSALVESAKERKMCMMVFAQWWRRPVYTCDQDGQIQPMFISGSASFGEFCEFFFIGTHHYFKHRVSGVVFFDADALPYIFQPHRVDELRLNSWLAIAAHKTPLVQLQRAVGFRRSHSTLFYPELPELAQMDPLQQTTRILTEMVEFTTKVHPKPLVDIMLLRDVHYWNKVGSNVDPDEFFYHAWRKPEVVNLMLKYHQPTSSEMTVLAEQVGVAGLHIYRKWVKQQRNEAFMNMLMALALPAEGNPIVVPKHVKFILYDYYAAAQGEQCPHYPSVNMEPLWTKLMCLVSESEVIRHAPYMNPARLDTRRDAAIAAIVAYEKVGPTKDGLENMWMDWQCDQQRNIEEKVIWETHGNHRGYLARRLKLLGYTMDDWARIRLQVVHDATPICADHDRQLFLGGCRQGPCDMCKTIAANVKLGEETNFVFGSKKDRRHAITRMEKYFYVEQVEELEYSVMQRHNYASNELKTEACDNVLMWLHEWDYIFDYVPPHFTAMPKPASADKRKGPAMTIQLGTVKKEQRKKKRKTKNNTMPDVQAMAIDHTQ